MTGVLDQRAADSAAHAHDPTLLWPGLDIPTYREALARITAAVQTALTGATGIRLDAPLGDAAVFGRAAYRLGVGPLLGWWIEAGAVHATADVTALFRDHLDHSRRRYARLCGELANVSAALRAASVASVLLKGIDSARFYPEPGARAFQDLDLFVKAEQIAHADDVLAQLGFVPGPLREGRRRDWALPDARLASLDLVHADNPWGVDLHLNLGRTFHRALLGALPDPEITACPVMTFGPATVRVLPPPLRLALLMFHASASLRLLQLSHLTDIVFAARATTRESPEAWSELIELLERAGSARFAYPPMVLAERLAPGCIPDAVIHHVATRAHGRLRRAADRLPLSGLSRPDRWNAVYAFMWTAGLTDIVSVIWSQLIPGRAGSAREQFRFQRQLVTKLLRGELTYDVSASEATRQRPADRNSAGP